MNRRARTRHLIELGGLVVKAGLVELTSDDRAVLLGAFLEIADTLAGENREQIIVLWRRREAGRFARSLYPRRPTARRGFSGAGFHVSWDGFLCLLIAIEMEFVCGFAARVYVLRLMADADSALRNRFSLSIWIGLPEMMNNA